MIPWSINDFGELPQTGAGSDVIAELFHTVTADSGNIAILDSDIFQATATLGGAGEFVGVGFLRLEEPAVAQLVLAAVKGSNSI